MTKNYFVFTFLIWSALTTFSMAASSDESCRDGYLPQPSDSPAPYRKYQALFAQMKGLSGIGMTWCDPKTGQHDLNAPNHVDCVEIFFCSDPTAHCGSIDALKNATALLGGQFNLDGVFYNIAGEECYSLQ